MKCARLTGVLTALVLLAGAGRAGAAAPSFTAKPSASKAGGKVTIRFAVSAPTDVEVAVLGATGKVVRRLAAGKLGARPPKPFRQGLSQTLTWDLRDDAGKPAAGGPFKIRVSLGMKPRLDRIIGWSGQKLGGPCGLVAGPDGTLYVIHSGGLYAHRGNWQIAAFDRGGKYVRELFPGPAGLPPEKRQGWPWLKLDDGAEVPVIWHLLPRTTYPGIVLTGRNFPVVTKDGRLVMLIAPRGDKNADLRGGRKLMILGTDGSVPKNLLGPEVCPRVGGFGHIALSPDEKYVYASGFVSTGRKGRGHQNVVYRLTLDGSEKSKVFIGGELYAKGEGKAALDDPQGIATDAKGNIYVSDYGHNRVAVFKPDGKYLDEIKVPCPDTVHVSQKTGAVYVVQIKPHKKPITDAHWYTAAHNWWAVKLIKFGGLKDKAEKASWTNNLRTRYGGGGYLALDESGPQTILWVSGMSYGGGPIMKFIDKGAKLDLVGTPIRDLAKKNKEVGLGYIGDVSVIGDKVITQHPAMGSMNPRSLVFNARTGEPAGYYTPKKADGKTTENVWSLLYGEAVAGADGKMYYHARSNIVRRYDITGKRLPYFPDKVGDKKTDGFLSGLWHGHTRGAGMFIDRAGTVYLPVAAGNRKLEDMKVKVIGSDGKVRNDCAVHVQNARMGGIAADSKGNIYVGAQAVDKKQRIPKWFAGKLPKESPAHHPRIDYMQYANIFKFPPTGGSILKDAGGTFTAIAQYRHANVKVTGALWTKRLGYIGSHGKELGCHCETTRFDIDGYDRLLAPDIFRFRVYVLDSAGNEITHFGGYGNMDSRGKGSPVPEPAIPFGWPLSAECANGKVYVADVTNKRVVAVKFEYAASAECAVR